MKFKKTITLLLMMAAAMNLAATTDRFYIEDFSIEAGETRQVEMLLDNETAYTAFQTDLMLPPGLTVEQEDDEYIFDLTQRKANDHTIISQMRSDGALRVVSFSMNVRAYTGNSGALVTFSLMAADDFRGTATIELKNTKFTTLDGQEVMFMNEICQVQGPAALQPGDVNGDDTIDIDDVTALIQHVLGGGDSESFNLDAANVNGDGGIDIDDVTTLIAMILH